MTTDLDQLTHRLGALTAELRELVQQRRNLVSEEQTLVKLCSSLQREYTDEVDRTLNTIIDERTETFDQTAKAALSQIQR